MGREEQGRTWCMDAAQLDTQRKKEEAILKTAPLDHRSSSSTRPAKLQLDRAEKSTVYANSIESVYRRLGRARLYTGRKSSERGMETLWAMDSVELGKLDRLVKEMLQTATNRDKGLFHHQCRTTTLRSSWE
ncbi:unnamed protein product [Microthlaspi erraticum]|uniref:Uncharacterized protein n=1 Tax=Microthlaspi erraticum TaxID=1685480 RepID=A0A6D2KES7_9BRAS|nr:unnamed protein product [Microthlaspi erraticum]